LANVGETLAPFCIAAALAAFFLPAVPSAAHDFKCFDADVLEARLRSQYGEVTVALAITTDGFLLQRWEGTRGTWTLTIRSPNPLAPVCVIGSGEGWREFGPTAAEEAT